MRENTIFLLVRERFNLNKNQTVMASRILADALESGLSR